MYDALQSRPMHHAPDNIGEAHRQIWALHQAPVDNVAVQLHLSPGYVDVVHKILKLNTVCMYLLLMY